ncbi:FAD dependent oxidoreductase [Staphylotrichum tortipilum]|uniref:FAD dependent oxidoreductase n=1 Tax=Staphylotrichum tortipilum TaxID=2831512 RepID=A0AAN6RX44_9PEZI|nr:FAD dependent oxidoreductase [Staphylotrichum longicolle]
MDKFIVIGTGVFGLSAAYHIRQRWPTAQLSVISQPSRLAPSDDISKIVRVDYNNSERMTEAVRAQEQWKGNNFSTLQRSIGRIVIYEQDDLATLEKINNARDELGLQRRQRGDSTLMQEFETIMAPKSLTYILAPDDSIVDWETCMSDARGRAKKACTDSGGTFYESGGATIVKDGARVTALMLENGERIEAGSAQVVLAVGPWFAQMLAASDITLPPNGRTPVATGLFSYAVQLNDEQAAFFRDRPMVSHSGKGSVGKLTWIHPFTNLHGSTISLVEDLSESALAKSHMHKAIEWARTDGVTETQDPIIARHPQFQNLVCAAGGSFNRAKDLPTIGSIVADVLGGQDVSERYSWEPETRHSHRNHSHLVARGDFATMEKEAQQHGQDSVADHSSLAVI